MNVLIGGSEGGGNNYVGPKVHHRPTQNLCNLFSITLKTKKKIDVITNIKQLFSHASILCLN